MGEVAKHSNFISIKRTRTLPAAVVISVLLGIALTRLLRSVGANALLEVSGYSMLATVPIVDGYLQDVLAKLRPNSARLRDVDYESFGLPSRTIMVYGTFAVVGLLQLVGFYVGVMAGLFFGQLPLPDLMSILGIVTPAALSALLFAVGIWVGTRARAHPALLLIGVGLLAQTLALLVDFSIVGQRLFDGLGSITAGGWAIVALLRLAPIAVGLVGCWYGRRRRLGHFLGQAIHELPPARQREWVHFAEKEVTAHLQRRLAEAATVSDETGSLDHAASPKSPSSQP